MKLIPFYIIFLLSIICYIFLFSVSLKLDVNFLNAYFFFAQDFAGAAHIHKATSIFQRDHNLFADVSFFLLKKSSQKLFFSHSKQIFGETKGKKTS